MTSDGGVAEPHLLRQDRARMLLRRHWLMSVLLAAGLLLRAASALLGVAGSVMALLRRGRGSRGRQLALACLLFTVTAWLVLLTPDVLEFSWRYQLPALVTLPPAGVLGLGAVLSGRRAQQESKTERVIETSDLAWIP